jgi:hypothetical protein
MSSENNKYWPQQPPSGNTSQDARHRLIDSISKSQTCAIMDNRNYLAQELPHMVHAQGPVLSDSFHPSSAATAERFTMEQFEAIYAALVSLVHCSKTFYLMLPLDANK